MASAQDVLELLKEKKGTFVSGEHLSSKLGVTRSAVWKHIRHLEAAGYKIEAITHKGYCLIASPDRLFPDEIQSKLHTKWFGKKIYAFTETTSTNDRALELADSGITEGALIVAEGQTKGRGRRERTWQAKPFKNLLFSLLFRPDWTVDQAPFITQLVAVAVAEAIHEELALKVMIKWPNDILVNDKKVAGLLTEMRGQADAVEYVVCGVGLNVNSVPTGSLRYPASSLLKVANKKINRIALLQKILQRVEFHYEQSIAFGPGIIVEAWKKWSHMIGTHVSIESGRNEKIDGMVMGLAENGALLVRVESGLIKALTSGEITRLRTSTT